MLGKVWEGSSSGSSVLGVAFPAEEAEDLGLFEAGLEAGVH